MRMLILAISIFVLVGIALGISRFDLIERVPQLLAGPGTGLSFEVTPDAEEYPSQVSVFRAHPDGVMILTTANRAQTARFQLPQDVALTAGTLALKATAQVADGQHSLLRVYVGNQIRGEVLLRPGQYDIDTKIELTANDLADDTLKVRYTLVVNDEAGACTLAANWPTVVEIEQDTRVLLAVDDTDLTPRDQVAAWGSVALVGWPNWLSEDERHSRWINAATLTSRGYRVRFVDAPNSETLTGNDMDALLASTAPAFASDEAVSAWPEYIASAGANAGSRTFKGTTTWRHWYRVGPHDHTSAPGVFNYELMLGPLSNGANWTIVVTHNGTILDVKEVAGRVGLVTGSLALTDAAVLDSNLIEITATSNYEPVGLCNTGPDLTAEMRSETRLLAGGDALVNEITAVKSELNQRQPVTVGFPENMSLVEAQRMLDLTFDLFDPDTELRVVDGPAVLSAVRRVDIRGVAETLYSSAFIVGLDQNKQTIVARPAAFTEGETGIASGAIVLVIAPEVIDRLSMAPPQ